MDRNYSIEVVEMYCAGETDRNAQVTTVVPVEDLDEQIIPTIPGTQYREPKESFGSYMTTNAATNWLLAGIMVMIFMFMIFRCD